MGICLTKPKNKPNELKTQKTNQVIPYKNGGDQAKKREIQRKYKFGQTVLGSGCYGKVFLAENKNDPSQKVAVKALSKKKLGKLIERLKQEVIYLRRLDSPNIIKYYETYEDENCVYLVMEYCPGGELFDLISQQLEKSKRFKEKQAAEIMQQLFKAISHAHSQGIAHRDIKPENIMIGKEGELKLIDFGLAQKFVKNNGVDIGKIIGTPQYLAPEAIEGITSLEVDQWSLGVIMSVLLSGSYPFAGSTIDELLQSIMNNPELTFEAKAWKRVSVEAKDLLRQLLQIDPKKRIKAKDALEHPWFQKYCPSVNINDIQSKSNTRNHNSLQSFRSQPTQVEDAIDPEVIHNLERFSRNASKFKKVALNVFVKSLNAKDINHLRKQFELLDVNHSGLIDAQELMSAIIATETDIKLEEVEQILASINLKGNGKINYSEFIAATLNIEELLTKEKLYALFKEFDHQDIEVLTLNNIKGALKRMGQDVTNEEIEQMLTEINISKDGQIDFEKFKEIVLSNEQLIVK